LAHPRPKDNKLQMGPVVRSRINTTVCKITERWLLCISKIVNNPYCVYENKKYAKLQKDGYYALVK